MHEVDETGLLRALRRRSIDAMPPILSVASQHSIEVADFVMSVSVANVKFKPPYRRDFLPKVTAFLNRRTPLSSPGEDIPKDLRSDAPLIRRRCSAGKPNSSGRAIDFRDDAGLNALIIGSSANILAQLYNRPPASTCEKRANGPILEKMALQHGWNLCHLHWRNCCGSRPAIWSRMPERFRPAA